MKKPVKYPSDMMISNSVVQPYSDGCFKVLIENHGMCPVHLEATSVVGSLSSITEITSEDLTGSWKQFQPVNA